MTRRLLIALAISCLGLTAAAVLPKPGVLGRIQAGEWQLRVAGGPPMPDKVCLSDPSTLIQLQHPNTVCSRFVLEDDPALGTVHYTCPGAGHGRTTIRLETRTLMHINSQGIARNAPFNTTIEARRIGDCPRG